MAAWNECPSCGTGYDTAVQAARCCRGRGNAAPEWRTACGASNTCVGLAAAAPGRVLIGDTADPAGPVLTVSRRALAAALRSVGTQCPNCRSVRSVRTAGDGRWRCGCGHRWGATC